MAEGGFDPDKTGTFDPNEGADDRTPFIPHHRDEMEMKDRTSTPMTSTSKRHTAETSFIDGTPSGVMLDREEMREKADKIIKDSFPNADTTEFFTRIKDGRVDARLKKVNSVWYPILDEDGDVLPNYKEGRFPKGLNNALGKSVIEIATEKIEENDKDEKEIGELRVQRDNTFPEDRGRIDERIRVLQERINERNQEIEANEERLSLRQRIKVIFKKYGFTAIAVATAIGTVIGVIVSNLKAGLTKVAKGVGNGLKELGKKLGEILPGMIGAIASFIFRTAGEVIGFLAKNAWLLVVGLVLLAVEQLKNKRK